MELLKTSIADSISNGITPYWNESCLAMSRKLLSHTKSSNIGSDLNSLNLFQNNGLKNSWFSVTAYCHDESKKSQSFVSSMYECEDLETTLVRSKKVRIYPKNPQQARKYLGLSRWWL